MNLAPQQLYMVPQYLYMPIRYYRYPDIHLPYKVVERTMLRRIRGNLPANPVTLADMKIALESEAVKSQFGTVAGEPFFDNMIIKADYAFTVFSAKPIVNAIEKKIPPINRNFLIDATFSIVPNSPFSQILVLHVQYFAQVFPFVFILMTRKSQKCYADVFKYVHENVISLQCQSFTTDNETAMRNALREQFPTTCLVACHFHFCQAVKSKAAEIGMSKIIQFDEKVRHIYICFQNIPLLPPQYIVDAFNALHDEARDMDNSKNEWQKFITYYRSQWIRKETPKSISVNDACMRTTSAVESINKKLSVYIVINI